MKLCIKSIIIIILIAGGFQFLQAQDELTGGMLDKKVNGDHEDYGAYLIYGKDTDTLFFTSSRPVKNRRPIALSAEIFFSTRPASYRETKQINKGWSEAQRIKMEDSRIAEFTRGSQAISEDRIIFAAERDLSTETASGTSYLFDLWQMTKRLDGYSLPEPLSTVNDIDAWDSQPALSTDGKTLFFVTNRSGGSGGLDIWYSVRGAQGNWGVPQPLPEINTEGDEVSPHCGADGKFYFSSNWNYDKNEKSENRKDIYRCEYRYSAGTQLPVNPVPLDEAIRNDAETYGLTIPGNIKYNSDKDDEFPFISPDRKAIFITSNRKADMDKRNIYAYKLPKSKIKLQVNVKERIFDSDGELISPPEEKVGLPLTLVELGSGTSMEITSGKPYEVDAEKNYRIKFTKFVEEECYSNKIEGPDSLKIYTERPFGLDTLYERDVLITRRKIEIDPVVFHSTDTLPYFITGYWYPNTSENIREFRKREANGFFDQTGFVDSTGYDYGKIANKIDKIFERKIYDPLEKMLPVFQEFCRDTLYLKVSIHGYTDPRGLSAGNEHPYRPQSRYKRIYPDKTVTVGTGARGNDVTIRSGLDMFKQSWRQNPDDPNSPKVVLPNDGEEGNVLLSKLRAYYTFKTFDEAMRERSPIYSQIRDNGKVILDAEGFGIDKIGYEERGLRDDPISRRIEIYIDVLRPDEIDLHKRLAGGKLLEEEKGIASAKPAESMGEKTTGIEDKRIKQEPGEMQEENIPQIEPEPEMDVQESTPEEETAIPEKENKQEEPVFIDQYKTISKPGQSKPLTPPEEKVKSTQRSMETEQCYQIQYITYDSKQKAQEGLEILEKYRIEKPKIVEYFDPFGNVSYRLRSGCYENPSDAAQYLNTLRDVSRELGIDKKPVIVR